MKKSYGFLRKGPDCVTEELASALSMKISYDFKTLFNVIYLNLRARKAAGGGEEMLRLRAYEKLQGLVQDGAVKKAGKQYRGHAPAMQILSAQMKAMRAEARGAEVAAVAVAAVVEVPGAEVPGI